MVKKTTSSPGLVPMAYYPEGRESSPILVLAEDRTPEQLRKKREPWMLAQQDNVEWGEIFWMGTGKKDGKAAGQDSQAPWEMSVSILKAMGTLSYWNIFDIKCSVNSRCTTCYLDRFIYCNLIAIMVIISTAITSHNHLFLLVVGIIKFESLSRLWYKIIFYFDYMVH